MWLRYDGGQGGATSWRAPAWPACQCLQVDDEYECDDGTDEVTVMSMSIRTPSIVRKKRWKQVILTMYYDRTLLLFSRPMRDKDTSALREMFQYSSLAEKPLDQWEIATDWRASSLWPSFRPFALDNWWCPCWRLVKSWILAARLTTGGSLWLYYS